MRIVDIREAKMHLSRLIDKAALGEVFVIARAGKPVVKVVAFERPAPRQVRRVGFMAGRFTVPDDFGRMGVGEIEQLFGGEP